MTVLNASGRAFLPLLPAGRRGSLSLRGYQHLSMALLFLAAAMVVVVTVNQTMRQQALREAESKARILVDHTLATHIYFARELKPLLLEQASGRPSRAAVDTTDGCPIPSIRRIDQYLQIIEAPVLYSKECAINAMYPGNEADPYERAFIEAANADPTLVTRAEVRVFGGEPYLAYLRRAVSMEGGCLRCHGAPQQAPDGLLARYGVRKGFARRPGELASAISVRVPLNEAYARATAFSWRLSGLLLGVLGALYGLLLWVSWRQVFSPMNRIREQALRITTDQEHLGEQLAPPHGRELSDMTIAFNAMSTALKADRDGLESRVSQRTEELALLNQRLQEDLAARRSAEDALRVSETRYRTLFETVDEAVAIYQAVDDGADFVFLDFNAAGERIEGIQRQELIGRSVQAVFPGVRALGLFAVFQRVWATGQPVHHPTGLYQDDRISGWRENQVYKLPSGEIVAVYRDQTERQQVATALLEERNRLKILIDRLPDLIYAKDLDSRFVMANQAVADIAGVPSTEHMLGHSDADYFSPELAAHYAAEERELLRTGQPLLDHEERLTDVRGKEHWYLSSKVPLHNKENEIIGLVGISRDITEHHRLEQELIGAQRLRAVGELSAGVSHNLNNILTAVLMPAQMLQRRLTDPAALELVQTILASAQRARDLVHRLHQCVRGDGSAAVQAVSLNEAVQEAIQAMRPRWKDETEAHGLTITLRLELGDLPPIRGTPMGIHDLLAILLLNALDAMPTGGEIAVRTRLEDRWVCLDFSDTGIGMDEQTRLRVFEPFFTTKMDVGSGLGLPMLHSTLTQWGGQVEVRSAPGQGATVTLRFAKWEGAVVPSLQPSVPVSSRPGRVLIVDDEPAVAGTLSRLLAEQHQVEICTDSRAAMARLQAGRYDVVLIDLAMPEVSGVQVAEHLRQVDPAAARILLTGWELEPDDARLAAFDFYLGKPVVDLDQLERLLRQAIALRDRRAGQVS